MSKAPADATPRYTVRTPVNRHAGRRTTAGASSSTNWSCIHPVAPSARRKRDQSLPCAETWLPEANCEIGSP
ncbi:hypothetical protein [Pseudonocardia halophobica]|uniref:hypothetical protein n=1 Tax=Pseudonocardia halophobica TaxID=29401 RepID=UPI0012DE239E|nr:hypothetical protein [Pseudonocardia halophobica]